MYPIFISVVLFISRIVHDPSSIWFLNDPIITINGSNNLGAHV